MLEKQIEKKVCDHAKNKSIAVYKFNSMARSNVPDRMFISLTGLIIFIEFKREGCKPTDSQVRELNRLRVRDVPAFVCDNVDQGKFIIDMMDFGVDMMKLSDDLWVY